MNDMCMFVRGISSTHATPIFTFCTEVSPIFRPKFAKNTLRDITMNFINTSRPNQPKNKKIDATPIFTFFDCNEEK